jgi:hypothetical protein
LRLREWSSRKGVPAVAVSVRAEWRLLVVDRVCCRGAFAAESTPAVSKVEVKKLIANAKYTEDPHKEIRGGQGHDVPKR